MRTTLCGHDGCDEPSIQTGKTYYIGARLSSQFHRDFYGTLIKELAIQPALDVKHQPGVSVQVRQDEENDYIFIMNFTENVSPSCWRRQLKIC